MKDNCRLRLYVSALEAEGPERPERSLGQVGGVRLSRLANAKFINDPNAAHALNEIECQAGHESDLKAI